MTLVDDVRVVEVSKSERQRLAAAHPEFTEHDYVVLVASSDAIPGPALAEYLKTRAELAEHLQAVALRTQELGIEDSLEECAHALEGVRTALVQLAAGSGKSQVVLELKSRLAELERPIRRWFLDTHALVTLASLAELDESGVEAATSQSHKLIDLLLERFDPPSSHAVLQLRANAQARADALREFGALSSAEVAAIAGSRAKNRAALASRWESEGRVFSVAHAGDKVYPAFQFDTDGKPLAVIREVAGHFVDTLRGWPLALWFVSANGWLGGRRPVDLLATEPQAVVEAAERGASELVF